MTLSPTGLAFAVFFLALGLVELYVFMRVVYPVMSLRHETAKVTYSHGRGPAFTTILVRLQSLVLMPLIGYVVGSHFFTPGAN
ncbi:MAG: hypothetical protein GYA66_13025 [Phyllobacteriaceae bacterium]|nr:hypothetical protein [Phyllobacteriaceae bacterium]